MLNTTLLVSVTLLSNLVLAQTKTQGIEKLKDYVYKNHLLNR